MIELGALGPLTITIDGADPPAEVLWRKNAALLVYLALASSRLRARQQVLGMLWGDKSDTAARHSLREAMRILKRSLGDDALSFAGEQVRLDDAVLVFDCDAFERCRGSERWAGAAKLIRGDFLEGFAVPNTSAAEDWLSRERATWRTRMVDVLVHASSDALQASRLLEAHEWAGRALDIEPASDAALAAAMKSLALSGHRSQALEVYDRYERRLTEIGISPTPSAVELRARVARERRWHPAAVAHTATSSRSRRFPLVAVQPDLEALVGLWETSRRGTPGCAIIEGDPGTGKTRLANELFDRARLDGATVSNVRAVEADLGTPWAGVDALMRGGLLDAPGLAAIDSAVLAGLVEIVPACASRFPTPANAAPVPPGVALLGVLEALADEHPVFLLFDDAHWVDEVSLTALHIAINQLNDVPVFVCLTHTAANRRDEIERIRAAAPRTVQGGAFQVGPIPPSAIREMIVQGMPGLDDSHLERLTRRITRDSGGVALLVVELLHAVSGGFDLNHVAPDWPKPFRTLDQTLPADLPEAVVGAVRVGFRRLTPDARRVVQTVAVVGDATTSNLVGRGSGLRGDALHAALDEAEWQRWLESDGRGYSFVARITRDVVLRDLISQGQVARIRSAVSRAEPVEEADRVGPPVP